DPSHATGRRDLVVHGSLAAFAVGAAGVMIEVHNDPENAKCDPQQALLPSEFKEFMFEAKRRGWL
ncbi:MAG: 3-deoxy-7-phosphoheptulonate synthase, partial [bacterium]|nr:3-deoxy-7-phosphoheptulonate synthase [bacterium]